MNPDFVIRNAKLVDGTGSASHEVDVAVTQDRISAVGVPGAEELGSNSTQIDAKGLTLAPGFVDVHSHDDGALISQPDMGFKLDQGCTSVVVGNCGFSAAPMLPGVQDPGGIIGPGGTWTDLAGFANEVHNAGVGVNAMALVGHNTIRNLVMGNSQQAPTQGELDQMKRHVATAMAQGACGFSTGLVYEPGRYSQTEEVIELASEAAPFAGLYATHMRNERDHLLEAVGEAIEVGRQANLAVQISHHKAADAHNWGKVAQSLALVDQANASGSDISLDVYPYTAGSGPMAQYFDHNQPDEILASVTRIATCPAFRSYEGQMVADIAKAEHRTPGEVVGRILAAPNGHKTICIQFIIDEADVETNMVHQRMMVGSDGIPATDGLPHPRLYGTFPRFLGRYVRERKLMGLPEAIRRITSMPCERFGMVDRGVVAEGQFADLVLFDPERVIDHATYDEPTKAPSGIEMVVVNGSIARGGDGGPVANGDRAGRFLRYRSSAHRMS